MTRFWVGLLLFPVLSSMAEAYNLRSACQFKMHCLVAALQLFRQVHGHLPTDIHDTQGRPLLSWRVRLLPYLDDDLIYKQFRLNESWDSPHNRLLVCQTPRCYRCPSGDGVEGTTPFLALRDGTSGPGGGVREIPPDYPPTVLVIEADEDQAVIWTKPEDLVFDPAAPGRGIGRPHWAGFGTVWGGFAAFADGSVRFVPENANEHLLRSILSSEPDRSVALSLSWREALGERSIQVYLFTSLGLALVAATGGLMVGYRLLTRQPTSPGELLWLPVGLDYLVHLVTVMSGYRFEPLPIFRSDQCLVFWFLPAAAATLGCVAPLVYFWNWRPWRGFFVITFLMFGVVAWDASIPQSHRAPEEAFLTAVSPITLALVGSVVAGVTFFAADRSAWFGRRRVHWIGILFCFIPLAWFLFCMAQGAVGPRELFVRIR